MNWIEISSALIQMQGREDLFITVPLSCFLVLFGSHAIFSRKMALVSNSLNALPMRKHWLHLRSVRTRDNRGPSPDSFCSHSGWVWGRERGEGKELGSRYRHRSAISWLHSINNFQGDFLFMFFTFSIREMAWWWSINNTCGAHRVIPSVSIATDSFYSRFH